LGYNYHHDINKVIKQFYIYIDEAIIYDVAALERNIDLEKERN